jgi:hypothetical protein
MSGAEYFPPERVEPDVCLLCGFEGWSCVCDPEAAAVVRTTEDLERGRRARLTRAEHATERDGV